MTKTIIEKLIDELPECYSTDSNTTIYQLLYSIALELEEEQVQIENLKLEIQISTSTGTYLDDIAKLFRLSRMSGETDAQLRSRIQAYWPGFSGGGTIDAFKATISRITGVDETNIVVTEITNMKVGINVLIDVLENLGLIGTIEDVAEAIKASGIYVVLSYTLTAGLDETFNVLDGIAIVEGIGGPFSAGVSVAGGFDYA